MKIQKRRPINKTEKEGWLTPATVRLSDKTMTEVTRLSVELGMPSNISATARYMIERYLEREQSRKVLEMVLGKINSLGRTVEHLEESIIQTTLAKMPSAAGVAGIPTTGKPTNSKIDLKKFNKLIKSTTQTNKDFKMTPEDLPGKDIDPNNYAWQRAGHYMVWCDYWELPKEKVILIKMMNQTK